MEIVDQYHNILTPLDPIDIYCAIERAGRVAYKSEDRITSASAEKFIRAIIQRGHESVIEHFNISVLFVTDRGVTHELVRHRLCAYTQESTRYCNYSYSKKGMVFIRPVFWGDGDARSVYCYDAWLKAMDVTESIYNTMIDRGATPQEARAVLPNSLKTEIVCTANIREWRHILVLRTSSGAHPQIRALMLSLLHEFKDKLPVLFDDIKEK
ncbi:MAG: FAD-dependent thymidylate synthase [Dehalococcoidia bacterium]|nr:FAD-dependent thymidylate synthase [Dehalococcoidia bacterium]